MKKRLEPNSFDLTIKKFDHKTWENEAIIYSWIFRRSFKLNWGDRFIEFLQVLNCDFWKKKKTIDESGWSDP